MIIISVAQYHQMMDAVSWSRMLDNEADLLLTAGNADNTYNTQTSIEVLKKIWSYFFCKMRKKKFEAQD
jgi:hypothetical protein